MYVVGRGQAHDLEQCNCNQRAKQHLLDLKKGGIIHPHSCFERKAVEDNGGTIHA